MTRLPMEPRGRKPRFFAAQGSDELLGAVLELATELWTVKERLFVVERAASTAGVDLPSRVESYRLTEVEEAELAVERRRMIETVLRPLEGEYDEPRSPPQKTESASRRRAGGG